MSSPSPLLLIRDEPLRALLERVPAVGEIALDCEFHGEKRYRPTLYLVQIAVGEEAVAVDPQRVDLSPLRDVLESNSIRKLFHAGREDVRLLVRATGATRVSAAFDTQVAAAFLGHGLTIGYARLVKDLLGVELDKSNQFTDWSRELTPEQVDYALNDVRYLSKVAALLRAELERRGRLDWALEASERASVTALVDPEPRRLYRKISGFASLGEGELGVLRELAVWRDAVAESENCRPETVASDAGLKQLALRPPARNGQLRGMRGIGIGGSERWWPDLQKAIERGKSEPEPRPPVFDIDPRVESMALMLGVVRRAVAMEHDIAPELLGSSLELRTLAEWYLNGMKEDVTPSLDLSTGWRRGVIGDLLVKTLEGKTSLRVLPTSPSGLEILGR
jgi:ribonuclease D